MMSIRKPFLYTFAIALGLLCAGAALAWSAPCGASPSACNVSAPINVSNAGQAKVGGIELGTGFPDTTTYTGLIVHGKLCLGGVYPATGTCITSWAGAGGSWATSGNDIYNSNSGSVGVGAVSPGQKLFVSGASTYNDAPGVGTFAVANSANTNRYVDIGYDPNLEAGFIQGLKAGVAYEPLLLNPNGGNVGIGTTNPTQKLGVSGNAAISGSLSAASATVGGSAVCTQNGANCPAGSAPAWASITLKPYSFNQSTDSGASPTFGNLTLSGGLYDSAGARMDAGGGWLRTYGATGWYNNTYAGGWYMQDATWIRSYGSKSVFMDAGFDTQGAAAVSCSGTLGGGYAFRVCGTANVTSNLTVAGAVTAAAFYYSSDARLKKNVETIASSKALQDILALRPVTYNWIDPARGTGNQLGFIAQQVEGVVPELVATDASTTLKAVDYARVAPLLVGAAQAQEARIDAQQKEIDALVAEVEALKAVR
jgi:hypothetical protein